MAVDDLPFRSWPKLIDAQFRIRIGMEIAPLVSWLPTSEGVQVTCFGFPGALGQLQLAKERPDRSFTEEFASILAKSLPRSEEAASRWIQFARLASAVWEMSCNFETVARRFTLVLPRAARELGILPESGPVVVFALGDILEVWRTDLWLNTVRASREDVETVLARTEEGLKDRGLRSA
jgi:hypothetical protein